MNELNNFEKAVQAKSQQEWRESAIQPEKDELYYKKGYSDGFKEGLTEGLKKSLEALQLGTQVNYWEAYKKSKDILG